MTIVIVIIIVIMIIIIMNYHCESQGDVSLYW
jgi:hypothetical protein